MNSEQKKIFEQEVSMIHYLNRKDPLRFATLYGFELKTQTMLLKYYPLGSLTKFFESKMMTKSRSVVISVLNDVAKALQTMHSLGMTHRDLKPQNVLVEIRNMEPHVVLTDFGLSVIIHGDLLKVKDMRIVNVGGLSPLYASPETFQIMRRVISALPSILMQADIYSFACLIYFCMNERSPWV